MTRLVLIETAGNQRFVFATNRLRENVGASEILFRVGTAFVLHAVAEQPGANCYYGDLAAKFYEKPSVHRSLERNRCPTAEDFVATIDRIAELRPLEHGSPVEVVMATSGKALLLVDGLETGRRIIRAVTLRALLEAPGCVVRGVIGVSDLDLASATVADVHSAVKQVHTAIERTRLDLPPPEARFPMLPIVMPCRSSGLAATAWSTMGPSAPREAVAPPVVARRKYRTAGAVRMATAAGKNPGQLIGSIEEFEERERSWLGIVHADGNGFGQIFISFDKVSGARSGRDYLDRYRKFSLSLELCGVAAFRASLSELDGASPESDSDKTLIIPLILGGDDLTVICDGAMAIRFAAAYLAAFEHFTEQASFGIFPSAIPAIAEATRGQLLGATGRLGAAAGVAIVKPHHPFHRAYRLAEDLLKSAKTATKKRFGPGISAFDFHVVFDDAANDLSRLRAGWCLDGGETELWARPYVVSLAERIDETTSENVAWARHRLYSAAGGAPGLVERIAVLVGDGVDRGLPRSQQHALRSALFQGSAVAELRFAQIRHRYLSPEQWAHTTHNGRLFFDEERERGEKVRVSGFLDALEVIDVAGRPAATQVLTQSSEGNAE
jgi:hypothetical protein